MSRAIILLFAVPLLAAAVSTLAWRRRTVQRVLTAGTLTALLTGAVALVAATRDGTVLAARVGTWPQGLAIVVAVDGLASLLLTAMLVMGVLALVLAALRDEDAHPLFHPLALVLLAGVALSVTTADLFNLFVAFEVMLIASYVLLTLRAGAAQVRAGVVYVAVNLFASTLFLLGTGLVYAVTGTVELGRLGEAASGEPAAVAALALVAIAAATKASLVPLHAWLPRTYVHASPAVTALFSVTLTKVGVYVLYRLTSLVLADVAWWSPVMLWAAILTMVVGVLGGLGGDDARGILAYHMVSQVGYLVVPLAIWSVGAAAGGVFYVLQYLVVKGTLFLSAAAIETRAGTGRLAELGGLARRLPWMAAGFLLPALALAGLPPTTGFVAKFLVVLAAIRADALLLAGTAVVVSLFTLMSMVKILQGAFWGEPSPAVEAPSALPPGRLRAVIALPVVASVLIVVASLASGELVALAEAAARALVDPAAYVAAVRGA